MKTTIEKAIREIERLDDVRVVYACESGSRAWGFESEDSDWDVRFIYVRSEDRYLSLTGQDDTIDRNTSLNMGTREYIRDICDEHDIDLAGWDLLKTLNQLGRGNPVLSEWFCSPIVYQSRSPYAAMIKEQIQWFYKNKAGVYHYEHMARRNFNKYIKIDGDQVIVKKYLYILRPLFAMAWLDTHETPPPMQFELLYGSPEVEMNIEFRTKKGHELVDFSKELVARKKEGAELGTGPRNAEMDSVIEFILDQFKEIAERMEIRNRKELSALDPLFHHIVTELNADWEEE